MVGRMLAHSSAPVAVLSANLAAGCVGLFAPLATVITALGLDWLHWWSFLLCRRAARRPGPMP